MKVAVFGGAAPKSGEKAYLDAERLGALLAKHGNTVMTGGYIGVMEAASRGANEVGGHVVGVTCKDIESWRKVKANAWVKEEWSYPTLRERMYALIDNCEAAIIMPGGVGTLAELAVMWNEVIISQNPPRPIILVGENWKSILASLFTLFGAYIGMRERELIQIVPDVESAVEFLQQKWSSNNIS